MAAASNPSAGAADAGITITRDAGPVLRFVHAPRDPRDLLDAGVNLLLTRDPATLDYAATLPQVRSVPLEWRRTYILLTPGRSPTAPSLPAQARQALADDAVRGEARGAAEPFWWQDLQGCNLASSRPGDLPAPTPRVVYRRRRRCRARSGRAAGGPRPCLQSCRGGVARGAYFPIAHGGWACVRPACCGEPLALARRRGTDAAYVMAFDRGPINPCRGIATAMESAPWLDPGSIVPLVDTRLQAIVRRGQSGLTADGDGALRIDASGARGGR